MTSPSLPPLLTISTPSSPNASYPSPTSSSSPASSSPSTSSSSSPFLPYLLLSPPRLQWKVGSLTEYVSKPRVFFDHYHHEITLFTGSPVSKCWQSNKISSQWNEYSVRIPHSTDILGAQMNHQKNYMAIRSSDYEVKIIDLRSGEIVGGRTATETQTKMIAVHWVKDKDINTNNNSTSSSSTATTSHLLFISGLGVEMYSMSHNVVPIKLRHVKTSSFPSLQYHWLSMDDGWNLLLLCDNKNNFQFIKFSVANKSLTKLAKFELDANNTSILNPTNGNNFHRDQINLLCLYGKIYVAFINEKRGQLHLLAMKGNGNQSEEMEQTHLFDIGNTVNMHMNSSSSAGNPMSNNPSTSPLIQSSYQLSVVDNLIFLHSQPNKFSIMIDIKTDNRNILLPTIAIGPPITSLSSPISPSPSSTTPSSTAPSSPPFLPYHKWTFLFPHYLWESTGDQQQGNFWSLSTHLFNLSINWISHHEKGGKKLKLFDFLMKRKPQSNLNYNSIFPKITWETEITKGKMLLFPLHPPPSYPSESLKFLLLELLRRLILLDPHSLPTTSRVFSLMNRVIHEEGKEGNNQNNNNTSTSIPSPYSSSGYLLLPPTDITKLFSSLRLLLSPTHFPIHQYLPHLIEYFRLLYRYHLKPNDTLNDLLCDLLIEYKYYSSLHQYLQYHILADSPSIADKLLLVGEREYYPAKQLGYDMLYRLNYPFKIIQNLVQKKQIIDALKIIFNNNYGSGSGNNPHDNNNNNKFTLFTATTASGMTIPVSNTRIFSMEGYKVPSWLEIAWRYHGPIIFYEVYRLLLSKGFINNLGMAQSNNNQNNTNNSSSSDNGLMLLFQKLYLKIHSGEDITMVTNEMIEEWNSHCKQLMERKEREGEKKEKDKDGKESENGNMDSAPLPLPSFLRLYADDKRERPLPLYPLVDPSFIPLPLSSSSPLSSPSSISPSTSPSTNVNISLSIDEFESDDLWSILHVGVGKSMGEQMALEEEEKERMEEKRNDMEKRILFQEKMQEKERQEEEEKERRIKGEDDILTLEDVTENEDEKDEDDGVNVNDENDHSDDMGMGMGKLKTVIDPDEGDGEMINTNEVAVGSIEKK